MTDYICPKATYCAMLEVTLEGPEAVIRCRDCKHYTPVIGNGGGYYCSRTSRMTGHNDYCSRAVRCDG